MTPKRTKAGTSRAAAAARRATFKAAYLANGHNATQAAITAGYSEKTAASQGQRLLRDVEISGELAEAAERAADAAGLNTVRTLTELRRVAYNDPRKFIAQDGTLKPVHKWDADMAGAVSSLEVREEVTGEGEERRVTGYVKKLKFWNKVDAIDKAMRHEGLFEKDNRQLAQNLAIQINLLEAPAKAKGAPISVNLLEGKR